MKRSFRSDFDGFHLDSASGLRHQRGGALKLQAKELALLCVLVRHAGQVVTTEKILKTVWGHLDISDSSVTRCVSRIRSVLEYASPGSSALIKTRYGQGYSFEGKATHVASYLNDECFGSLIDTSPSFIVIKDEHGKWLTANLAAQTFSHLQDRHWQGKSDLELAESLPEFGLVLGTLAGSSHDVWKNKTPLKTLKSVGESDGSTRYFEVVQTPIFHADGTPNVLMIYGRDITDSCAADANAQLADQILKNSRDPLVVTDASNTIVSINHAFTAVTGYTDNEVIGKNPRVFASGCHPPEFYRSMWDRIYIEGAWCGEIWDKKKNGELYQKWLDIKVIRDALGCPRNYLGIYFDSPSPLTARWINSS